MALLKATMRAAAPHLLRAGLAVILLSCLSMGSTAAVAGGLYAAIDFGQAHHNEYNCHLIPPGLPCDTGSNATRIGVGYRFSRIFAMEVNYGAMGSIKWSGTSLHPGVPGEGKITATQVAAIVAIPLSETISVFGKVGPAHTSVTVDDSAYRNTGVSYGLGTQYDLSETFALRVQYENFGHLGPNLENPLFSLLTAGILLKF